MITAENYYNFNIKLILIVKDTVKCLKQLLLLVFHFDFSFFFYKLTLAAWLKPEFGVVSATFKTFVEKS